MAVPAPASKAQPLRPARDRAATQQAILDAVGTVLAREGFTGMGVNAVAKQAGIDKVLIYRYFGGLPGLIKTWGGSASFWPDLNDLLRPDAASFLALPPHERYARFIDHFIDGLRSRPLTIEILAAEVAQRSELTAILESAREAWGEQAERLLAGDQGLAQYRTLRPVTQLLIAGVQYLLVRSRTIRLYGGMDIRSDAAWAELKRSCRAMAQAVLAQHERTGI